MANGSSVVLKDIIEPSLKTSLRSQHYNQTALSSIDENINDSTESLSIPSSESTETLAEGNVVNHRQEPLSIGSGISDETPTLCAIKQDSLQSNSHLHHNGSNQPRSKEKLLGYNDSIRETRRAKAPITRVTSEGFTALKNLVEENFRIMSHRVEACHLQQQHLSASSIPSSLLSHRCQIESDYITMLERSMRQMETEIKFYDTRMQQMLEHMQATVDSYEKLLLVTKTDLRELSKKNKQDVWYLDDMMTDFKRQLQPVKRNGQFEDDYGDTSIYSEQTIDHEEAY